MIIYDVIFEISSYQADKIFIERMSIYIYFCMNQHLKFKLETNKNMEETSEGLGLEKKMSLSKLFIQVWLFNHVFTLHGKK